MLIREKLEQAVGLLREFDLDCWLTFTRESAINGDPVLPFLKAALETWKDVTFNYESTDTPDFAPTATPT